MELPVQDSCLALRAPALYIVRACLYIYGMFTSDRGASQSWEHVPRGGAERKHPFSPLPAFLVCNWSGICSELLPEYGSRELATGRAEREPWSPSAPGVLSPNTHAVSLEGRVTKEKPRPTAQRIKLVLGSRTCSSAFKPAWGVHSRQPCAPGCL